MNFTQYVESQNSNSVALLPGGFKPPTKGHFRAFKYILEDADKGIVFIGSGDRELVENEPEKGVITQAQSKAIWEIYAKHLGKPIEVRTSANTPVRDVYKYADANPDLPIIVGAGGPREIKPGVFDKGDMKRYEYFVKNPEKYPLVRVVQIPSQEKGMRATVMRELLAKDLDAGIEAFAPLGDDGITESDKDAIKSILGG
jgi:hypothetical protein